MATRYEQLGKHDTFDDDLVETPDHEISLGTTTVLGIFVALALVCALFFGFGYSMGRRSTPPILGGVDAHVSTPSPDAETAGTTADAESTTPPSSTGTTPAEVSRASSEGAPKPAEPTPRITVRKPSPQESTPQTTAGSAATPPKPTVASTGPDTTSAPARPTPAAAKPVTPPVPTTGVGQSFVQVAAISHKEDADLLLASLRRRGYAATARPGAQDNLLHIQVGPLASKKDADAMRQRLLADGYNAIVK